MATKAPPVLAVEGLRITRGQDVILDNVSWRVERGEHWVILGANGSGKTSLLSALTAYLTPSAGRIEVLGATYGKTDWRELRQRIGIVSSSVRQMIHDGTTALEVIASGRDATVSPGVRLSARDRERALLLLRLVDAVKLASRPWAVLSQGERQRILFGRALMPQPAVLILDEPCAGLDPLMREAFLRFIQEFSAQGGPPMVLVTHHVEEIIPLFTHALLLREGRVLTGGPMRTTLTTANLEATFGAPLRLRRDQGGRYTLKIERTLPREAGKFQV